jgi:hypothetical protein
MNDAYKEEKRGESLSEKRASKITEKSFHTDRRYIVESSKHCQRGISISIIYNHLGVCRRTVAHTF